MRRGNDNGSENQRRKNGFLRRCQIRDIQHTQVQNGRHEHSQDNGEVLGNIVGDEGGNDQGPAGDQQLRDLHHFQNLGGGQVRSTMLALPWRRWVHSSPGHVMACIASKALIGIVTST